MILTENIDGRLILTAEVAKNKMAKRTKILTHFPDISVCNTNLPGGLTFFRSAPEEGACCKPKYRANLFKYILVVLAILSFITFTVRISLPSVFCILNNLLIQVYKRSGTTHRFVAVVLQTLIVFNLTNPMAIRGGWQRWSVWRKPRGWRWSKSRPLTLPWRGRDRI